MIKITIRATVADGATNEKTDSIVVTIADTSGPSLIVSTSKANRPVSGGDTLDVRVTANDSSGIAYAGYRLLRVRPTDSVLVRAESTFVAAGVRAQHLPDAGVQLGHPGHAAHGQLRDRRLRPRSLGHVHEGRQAWRGFSLVDGTNPVLTFLGPIAGAKLNVGDSLLVTAHLTDNIALQKVSFIGISTRTPTAGIDQIITRYPQVSAPSARPSVPASATRSSSATSASRRRSTPSPTRSSSPAS